jgi:hypothetical protein
MYKRRKAQGDGRLFTVIFLGALDIVGKDAFH